MFDQLLPAQRGLIPQLGENVDHFLGTLKNVKIID